MDKRTVNGDYIVSFIYKFKYSLRIIKIDN